MKKTILLLAIILTAGIVAFSNSRALRLRYCHQMFMCAGGYEARDEWIAKAKPLMDVDQLPFIMTAFNGGRDSLFPLAMLGQCTGPEADAKLWGIARDTQTLPRTRVLCFSYLIDRGHDQVWNEMTDDDIVQIATHSVPLQLLHWEYILKKHAGATDADFDNDPFPNRPTRQALLRKYRDLHRNNPTAVENQEGEKE